MNLLSPLDFFNSALLLKLIDLSLDSKELVEIERFFGQDST